MDDFPDQVREATGGVPLDAVMDLVGGDMTMRFIETMIFDMNARSTYPRLRIAGASGVNVIGSHVDRDLSVSGPDLRRIARHA